MFRIFPGKLRSSTPGRRHEWFLRKLPSIQYPQLYKYWKLPKHATHGDQNRKWHGGLTRLSICADFMTSAIPIRCGCSFSPSLFVNLRVCRPYVARRAFLSPWKKTGRTRTEISTAPRITPKLMTIGQEPCPDTKEVKNGRNLLRIYLQPHMLRWTPIELNQWL